MTAEEKKAFLRQYIDCEQQIQRLGEEIRIWRARAETITASFGPAVQGGQGPSDRIGEAVGEIERLERTLALTMGRAAEIRRRIGCAIHTVEEERLRLLLEYYYVDRLTLEEIAEKMHYSWRQISNLHRKAIALIRVENGEKTKI